MCFVFAFNNVEEIRYRNSLFEADYIYLYLLCLQLSSITISPSIYIYQSITLLLLLLLYIEMNIYINFLSYFFSKYNISLFIITLSFPASKTFYTYIYIYACREVVKKITTLTLVF